MPYVVIMFKDVVIILGMESNFVNSFNPLQLLNILQKRSRISFQEDKTTQPHLPIPLNNRGVILCGFAQLNVC